MKETGGGLLWEGGDWTRGFTGGGGGVGAETCGSAAGITGGGGVGAETCGAAAGITGGGGVGATEGGGAAAAAGRTLVSILTWPNPNGVGGSGGSLIGIPPRK